MTRFLIDKNNWRISPEEWLKTVASQPFADADYLRPFAEQYRTAWAAEAGLPVHPVGVYFTFGANGGAAPVNQFTG